MRRGFTLSAFLLLAVSASAWNGTGHMVIAAIAQPDLKPEVRAEVDRLVVIGSTPEAQSFITSGPWADQIRDAKSGPWHYINYHFRTDKKRVTNQPDPENVVVAIERFRKVLADRSKPDTERGEALRFLVHFVADVHQPLHAVARDSEAFPKGDRGGNDFTIAPPEEFQGMDRPPKNLHSLWDGGSGLFPWLGATNPTTLKMIEIQATTLRASLPRRAFRRVRNQNPTDWAKEGLTEAKKTVYNTPEGKAPSAEYMAAGRALAANRATLAGYRLADLLNQALSGPG